MDTASLKSRIINFWYYHKVKLLFGLFILAILIYGFQSCIFTERPDISIVVASDILLNDNEKASLQTEIEPYVQDINGDGKVKVAVISLDLSQNINKINTEASNAMQNKMTVEITAGDSCIFILKKNIFDQYEQNSESKLFDNLKDITGVDQKYIKLSETTLSKTEVGKTLPEDMVIALRGRVMFGTASDKVYEASKNVLKKITQK